MKNSPHCSEMGLRSRDLRVYPEWVYCFGHYCNQRCGLAGLVWPSDTSVLCISWSDQIRSRNSHRFAVEFWIVLVIHQRCITRFGHFAVVRSTLFSNFSTKGSGSMLWSEEAAHPLGPLISWLFHVTFKGRKLFVMRSLTDRIIIINNWGNGGLDVSKLPSGQSSVTGGWVHALVTLGYLI